MLFCRFVVLAVFAWVAFTLVYYGGGKFAPIAVVFVFMGWACTADRTKRIERRQPHEGASERAALLLDRLLTPEQKEQAAQTGWFVAGVLSNEPIFVSVNSYGGYSTIRWKQCDWCIRPGNWYELPEQDNTIAQLLHAQTDPRALIAQAYQVCR